MTERTEGCTPFGNICKNKNDGLCGITADRIFDAVKEKDCIENLRVYLCDDAQEIIDRCNGIRTLSADIVDTAIHVEPLPFNGGCYQVTVRFYFCFTFECCACGISKTIRGVAAYDKKVMLYGGEKKVNVFTSNPENDSFCADACTLKCTPQSTLPKVVCEVAAPICLDTKIVRRCNPCNCCMCVEAVPDNIRRTFEGNLCDGCTERVLVVTLGLFTVISLERPVKIFVPCCDYAVPEREKGCTGGKPACIFGGMDFPDSEFFPEYNRPEGGCRPLFGCDKGNDNCSCNNTCGKSCTGGCNGCGTGCNNGCNNGCGTGCNNGCNNGCGTGCNNGCNGCKK